MFFIFMAILPPQRKQPIGRPLEVDFLSSI